MSRQRVLFFQQGGMLAHDVFADVIDGYRQAGHDVFVLDLDPLWARRSTAGSAAAHGECVGLFADTVRSLVTANGIGLAVCLWANGPFSLGAHQGRSFFEHYHVPVLMQWLDAPQWAHQGQVLTTPPAFLNGPYSFHQINNAATAQEMAGVLGFSNIITLSNAANPAVFRPHPADRKDFDVVFAIGPGGPPPTPLMLAELEKDEPDVPAIRADVAAGIRGELCDLLRPVWNSPDTLADFVDYLIAARLKDRNRPIMQQIGDAGRREPRMSAAILQLLRAPKTFVDCSMMLRRIEGWERAFTFAYLSRFFRCATFGGEGPAGWPGRWESLGRIGYADQAQAYSRSWFGLNVMRWQDEQGLNLKPFEITLSGAGLLQSHRVGLDEHFDESEIVVFRTPGECRRKAAALLQAPDRLREIAVAGRARSLRQHCWKHRADVVIRMLSGEAPPAPVSVADGAAAPEPQGVGT